MGKSIGTGLIGRIAYKDITGAYTVPVEESGMTYLLNGATGAAITMPGVSRGLYYKFIVKLAFSTDWVITFGATTLNGAALEAGLVQLCSNQTLITLEDGVEELGDWFSVECDGTKWFIDGAFSTANSFTVGT